MSPSASRSPPPTVVSWSRRDQRRLADSLRYGATGLVGGTILVALTLVAVAAAGAVRTGEYRLVAFVVLALVLGGPFSLVVLAVVASRSRLRDLFPGLDALRLGPLVLASVVGAAAVFVAFRYPPVLFGYLVAGLLAAVVVSARNASGTIDVETGTLVVPTGTGEERVFDLSGLRSVTRHRVGGVVVFRLRFVGTRGLSGPSFVSVPAERAEDVRAAFEAISNRTSDASGVSSAASAVLAVFGVGTLALAVGSFVLFSRGYSAAGRTALGVYVPSFLAFFGVLFLFVAVRSRR
ncbi:hypothetical protein GJR96_06095 [Haloferax sp. MBLA0076]|uniref:Uncharacterized protein n=1 Tax=Haloferax litoreum TaxID=2666140 RepID=A0A6A8GF92_9EURY|nr:MULTISPECIES: hypothetical protein [Haloferax]KAB1193035.1 hypothetical protein Hfx1148_06090 [Haloferax sp. CBA1148]MRX21526.1 hypothetical protein [Haloferax litoreum]